MKKTIVRITAAAFAVSAITVGSANMASAVIYTATCATKVSDSGPVYSWRPSAVIKINNSCGKAHKFKVQITGGPDSACTNINAYTTKSFTYVAFLPAQSAYVANVVYC